MVNMVEKANSMYNRNYLSVVRDKGKNGDILVFKGDGEMTMLESEFEYHIQREVSSRRVRDFEPLKPFIHASN